MPMIERLKWIILPALFVIGFGILEIKFPHAMDGFDDNYTGRGAAGLILLLIELFLILTWGKIGGIVAISLGVSAIAIGFFPIGRQVVDQSTETSITENDRA